MNATILLLSFAIGSPDDDARAALALAQAAKAKEVLPVPKKIDLALTYAEGQAVARATGKDLLTYVGIRSKPSGTYIVCEVPSLPGYPPKCVVRSRADDDGHYWVETLGADGKAVQPLATFFGRPGEVPVAATADDDEIISGLLTDLEPYATAMRTQLSFRRFSGYISSVPRSSISTKWRVPGHLEGVEGWSSQLYKSRGVRARAFLVRQDPNDGSSTITWSRSYSDVTFVDVLRNAVGKVFEVRMAVKERGRWHRSVAYKNVGARPRGYVRPTSADCRACHNEAGMSAYGGAAVPGADTIFSEPIEEVESGDYIQGGNGVRL